MSAKSRRGPGRSAGVRAIALYKTAKGAIQIALAVLLVGLLPFGLSPRLHHAMLEMREHATRAWGVWLAELLVQNTSAARLKVVALALGLDGTLTSVEGWALRRGQTWGAWLVVAASGALLPFEVRQLWRHPHWPQLIALAVNLTIVGFLASKARAPRRRDVKAR